jgi:tetratricopeptide (TPR) repeat protein
MNKDNPNRDIQSALASGDKEKALVAATRGLRENPDSLESKLWMAIVLEFCGKKAQSIKAFEQVHADALLQDTSLSLLGKIKYAFGIALLDTDDFGRAAFLLHESSQIFPGNPGIYEALVKVSIRTGAQRRAREYGQQALNILDHSVDAIADRLVEEPAERPRYFNPEMKSRNIIAFSLTGKDAFLHDCAIRNARLALEFYPEFTARFYCNREVPDTVRKTLKECNAQVQLMPDPENAWEATFWPMWAFDDLKNDVVLVRQIRVGLSERERSAVMQWLVDSTLPFHTMRDHLLHCTPLREGMWGGFTHLLPPLQLTSQLFLNKNCSQFSHQQFLLKTLWPRIREISVSHDAHYSLRNSRNFPDSRKGSEYVGQKWMR